MYGKSPPVRRFYIDDDGKAVTITLTTSNTLQQLTGKLTRRNGKPDSKWFDGTLKVTVIGDSTARTVHVIGILSDANSLSLRCSDWPVITGGVYKPGPHVTFEWTRVR